MIDRVGSFSVSQGPMDRAGRPGRVGDFADAMLGATEQANQNATAPSPLRLNRLGARTREAGQPATAPGTVSGSGQTAAPSASPRARTASAGAGGPAPAVVFPETPAGASAATAPTDATSLATHFVRASGASAPNLVRFSEVPESAQYPLGPYRQAPPEFGGDWWFVNPFTGPEPWRALEFADAPAQAALETPAPEDFVRIFGPRPDTRTAAAQWEQDLGYFQGTGLPEGFNEAQLEAATAEFEAWGLGEPVFYEGRYGWQVRFPDSQLPMFETTASTALLVPHLVIAEHQVRSIQEGVAPGRYHPWLPDRLRSA